MIPLTMRQGKCADDGGHSSFQTPCDKARGYFFSAVSGCELLNLGVAIGNRLGRFGRGHQYGVGDVCMIHVLSRLERIHKKCTRFLGSNARQNKDLEHVSDSIFCERALEAARGVH